MTAGGVDEGPPWLCGRESPQGAPRASWPPGTAAEDTGSSEGSLFSKVEAGRPMYQVTWRLCGHRLCSLWVLSLSGFHDESRDHEAHVRVTCVELLCV